MIWWNTNTDIAANLIHQSYEFQNLSFHENVNMVLWLYVILKHNNVVSLDLRLFILGLLNIYKYRDYAADFYGHCAFFKNWVTGKMCTSCYLADLLEVKDRIIFDNLAFDVDWAVNPRNILKYSGLERKLMIYKHDDEQVNYISGYGIVLRKYGDHAFDVLRVTLCSSDIYTLAVAEDNLVDISIKHIHALSVIMVLDGMYQVLKSIDIGAGDHGLISWTARLHSVGLLQRDFYYNVDSGLKQFEKNKFVDVNLIYNIKYFLLTFRPHASIQAAYYKRNEKKDKWWNIYLDRNNLIMDSLTKLTVDRRWSRIVTVCENALYRYLISLI